MEPLLENIIKEAKRLEEDCEYSSAGHWAESRRWNYLHLMLGVPAAIISALGGVSLISDLPYSWVVGVLSLIIAVLTGISTFLNPQEKKNLHHEAGIEFNSLRQKIRMFENIDCLKESSLEELEKTLKKHAIKKMDMNRKYPPIPQSAYVKAKKSIECGETSYRVDNLKCE